MFNYSKVWTQTHGCLILMIFIVKWRQNRGRCIHLSEWKMYYFQCSRAKCFIKKNRTHFFFLQIFANNANTKPKAKSEVIILAPIVLDSPIDRDIGLILVWYLMTPYWTWLCCPLACGGWGAPTHYPKTFSRLTNTFGLVNRHPTHHVQTGSNFLT